MTADLPPPIPFDDQPWAHKALCRRRDPEIFFPKVGQNATEAKAVCASCDVTGDCLTWALERRIPHGVWGGATERERRLLLRGGRPGKPRRLTAAQIDEVCRLYAAGATSTAIGERYGVDPNVILRRLHERGVKVRPSPGHGRSAAS